MKLLAIYLLLVGSLATCISANKIGNTSLCRCFLDVDLYFNEISFYWRYFFDQVQTLSECNKASHALEAHKVSKRQIPYVYDFGFMDYAAYDYYDYVCTKGRCQVCDVLTGACCNPRTDQNCFLPESCINNPCLSGGTCIETRTVDNQPDFVCACHRGLTGKYCQLVDDFSPLQMFPYLMQVPYQSPANGRSSQPSQPQPSQPQTQPPSVDLEVGPKSNKTLVDKPKGQAGPNDLPVSLLCFFDIHMMG